MDQLKGQMEKNFSPSLMGQLFHSDFKFHIKAIEQLIAVSRPFYFLKSTCCLYSLLSLFQKKLSVKDIV